MPGELVVRLRNLSWSASATDIRGFFRGLDIPNGGVKIIGGDDGDCFVLFTTEADAHNALRKDGMYLNDQRIRLDPSKYVRSKVITIKVVIPSKNSFMYCMKSDQN